jgi:predicted regulator of Ras-like GTPase activity (Roadblock/LC7/MglB family)
MADPYYCGTDKKTKPDQPAEPAPAPSPSQFKTELLALIDRLLAGCAGTTGALIVTDDGFPIVYRLSPGMDPNRLAAITSSLLGLSESMAREGSQGKCDNVILENGEGNAVMMRIDRLRILTALAVKDTRLGMLISATRKCAIAAAGIGAVKPG